MGHPVIADNRKEIQGNIDAMSSVTLHRHIDKIPGISSFTYYIGGAFTFFPYHIGDEWFSSISHIASGAGKVRYVVPSSSKVLRKTFVAQEIQAP